MKPDKKRQKLTAYFSQERYKRKADFEKALGSSPYKTEYRFHPDRMWRIDYAFPEHKLGLEWDGGVFVQRMGHSTGSGIRNGHEKANAAVRMGWEYYRFCTASPDVNTVLLYLAKKYKIEGFDIDI